MENLQTYFPVLGELSVKAGAIARRHYNSQVEFERKSDDSPVTKADREIETFLRQALEKQFPDHSILGEEFGETKKNSSYRWILDPIDGTKSFVLRTPLFGIMIALERDGVPVLGSIYFPIQEHWLIGSAETGTFLNGKPCSVSKTTKLPDATMILTNPRELYSETHGERLQRLAKNVRLVRGFGDCYGYYLVATGLADLMIEPGQLKYYDVAPMPPILAGCRRCVHRLERQGGFAERTRFGNDAISSRTDSASAKSGKVDQVFQPDRIFTCCPFTTRTIFAKDQGRLENLPYDLRQFPDANVFEFNRRTFGFKTHIPRARFSAIAAGNFFAIYPQTNFAIDGANVIVIPFANAFAQILARKAARTVGRQRRKRFQFGIADGKNVAVGGEPVAFFA
jgi:Archaeal fructose-1,6-bisphosphatase and related enzymes of inositol monophosphatase family